MLNCFSTGAIQYRSWREMCTAVEHHCARVVRLIRRTFAVPSGVSDQHPRSSWKEVTAEDTLLVNHAGICKSSSPFARNHID